MKRKGRGNVMSRAIKSTWLTADVFVTRKDSMIWKTKNFRNKNWLSWLDNTLKWRELLLKSRNEMMRSRIG
jgi:hypothetical protein